jgi:phosphoglycolate phosphatase
VAAIIFDFDGTIADSFGYIIGFLSEDSGVSLSDAQKQELRGRSMVALARHFGYHWWRMPSLFFKGRRKMAMSVNHVKPFEGITEIIEKLHVEGHELFIVSSNTVKNIHDFLHTHELHTYFLEVYGGAGLFGKAPALRKLLKEQQLDPKDAIYIGDELRDVQAAQHIDLRVIAVTWGFARPADLENLKPTALAKDPADLMRILEEL